MKKELILGIIFVLFITVPVSAFDIFSKKQNSVIKNSLFSITMPENLNGLYETNVKKYRISVYDTASKNAGFGGFAFGVKAYKNPADYANLPGGKKIGELRKKSFWKQSDDLYDVVLKYPTDVQYDYTKSPKAPESYKLLYDSGEGIGLKISGVKGSTYYNGQGTKGEDLYKEIIQKHKTALNEKWDSIKLEQENMSYMYNIANKIGYTYYDVNGDGIDELLIGEIAQGDWKGIIYDIYTMVNRTPQHVISGGSRNRYFVCGNGFICNEYSGGANESGLRVYILLDNSTELFSQVSFKYDGYENPTKPWFVSYGGNVDEDRWENVTEEYFNERKQVFEQYQRFDYIPLNKNSK